MTEPVLGWGLGGTGPRGWWQCSPSRTGRILVLRPLPGHANMKDSTLFMNVALKLPKLRGAMTPALPVPFAPVNTMTLRFVSAFKADSELLDTGEPRPRPGVRNVLFDRFASLVKKSERLPTKFVLNHRQKSPSPLVSLLQ